jgi:hypothetical protein
MRCNLEWMRCSWEWMRCSLQWGVRCSLEWMWWSLEWMRCSLVGTRCSLIVSSSFYMYTVTDLDIILASVDPGSCVLYMKNKKIGPTGCISCKSIHHSTYHASLAPLSTSRSGRRSGPVVYYSSSVVPAFNLHYFLAIFLLFSCKPWKIIE